MAETDPMMQAEFQSRVSLASENDRLRSRVAELDELSDNRRHKIKQMAAVLGGLRQENADLREALEPFARVARIIPPDDGDDEIQTIVYGTISLRAGQFRKARAALGSDAREPSVTVNFRNTSVVAQNEYLLEVMEEVAKRLDSTKPDVGMIGTAHLLLMRAIETAQNWDVENAPQSSPSSALVAVPRKLLEPFVRIAERLEACETSRKLPDSAPLSAPMDDIPEKGTYVSLGDVRKPARLAKGNPSETPISSGKR